MNQEHSHQFDPTVLESLDWHQIKLIISHNLCFDKSVLKYLEKPQISAQENILYQYELLKKFCDLLNNNEEYDLLNQLKDFSHKLDLDQSILKLSKSGVLEIEELVDFARMLRFFDEIPNEFILLFSSNALLDDWKKTRQIFKKEFVSPILSLLRPDATIDWSRHPMLSSLFMRLEKLDHEVSKFLKEFMNRTGIKEKLQFDSFDILFDHYVVPMRTDSYQHGIGQIIGRSQTGSTVFVEPFECRDFGQQRIEIQSEIQEFIFKFCRLKSLFLTERVKILELFFDVLIQIDWFNGKFRWTLKHETAIPEVTFTPNIHIKDLYHPLITEPIKNDVLIENEKRGILISGPNTGGKTVYLKAIGINVIFFHLGIPLTCQSARLFTFKNLVFWSGDHQKLDQGLSSFSSEVKFFLSVLEQNNDHQLFLIDEIFNSTGSDEASALAYGLFHELFINRNNRIVCTTHHHLLKVLIHRSTYFSSAHMVIDPYKFRPTYKIKFGEPGASFALKIFKTLGQNFESVDHILQLAQDQLNNKASLYESLIEEVGAKNAQLTILLQENKEIGIHLKNQKKSQEAISKLKIQEEVSLIKNKFSKLFDRLEKEVEDNRKSGSLKSFKNKAIDEFSAEIRTHINPKETIVDQNRVGEVKPTEGQFYYSRKLRGRIQVQKLNHNNQTALVGKGAIKGWVPFDDLAPLRPEEKPSEKSFITVSSYVPDDLSVHWDARGMRLEEFESMLENKIAHLLSGQIPFLQIIHGHGTGALKGHLRSRVMKDPSLMQEQSQENDDGATTIKLKN